MGDLLVHPLGRRKDFEKMGLTYWHMADIGVIYSHAGFSEIPEGSANTLKMMHVAKLLGIGRETGVVLTKLEERNWERSQRIWTSN